MKPPATKKPELSAYKLGVIRRVILEDRHEATVRAESWEAAARQLAKQVAAGEIIPAPRPEDQERLDTIITVGAWVDGEWVDLLSFRKGAAV